MVKNRKGCTKNFNYTTKNGSQMTLILWVYTDTNYVNHKNQEKWFFHPLTQSTMDIRRVFNNLQAIKN